MAEEAIRSDPTNKQARYDLGFGYTKMGMPSLPRIRMRPPHGTENRSSWRSDKICQSANCEYLPTMCAIKQTPCQNGRLNWSKDVLIPAASFKILFFLTGSIDS